MNKYIFWFVLYCAVIEKIEGLKAVKRGSRCD